MPELQKLHPQFQEAGVALLGISLDVANVDKVPGFLERFSIRYPNVTAAQDAMGRVYATDEATIPLSFVLDEEGRVVDVLEGWSPQIQDRVLRLLESAAPAAGEE